MDEPRRGQRRGIQRAQRLQVLHMLPITPHSTSQHPAAPTVRYCIFAAPDSTS
jgi:hypothetical protein